MPKTKKNEPLVSVLVYNYNYGKYLRQCLESIVTQTYKNIEIIFSDNASTDDSWSIALAFQNNFEDKFTLIRNRKNFGVDANYQNCITKVRGKYFINMCSDDVMLPKYIETCVSIIEKYPELGFVMVHRTIINKEGKKERELPFYDTSCIIKGEEQAAIYMMAAVNPSASQIMYNTIKTIDNGAKRALGSRWYAQRILDFNITTKYPIAYIAKPLLLHRIHGKNDSLKAANDLMEVIGPYVLSLTFTDTAQNLGLKKVIDRSKSSINKVGSLSIRYCLRSLQNNDFKTAKKYFYLSKVFLEDSSKSEVLEILEPFWTSTKDIQKQILEKILKKRNLLNRETSYKVPAGSKLI